MKQHRKKLLIILVCLLTALSLTACSLPQFDFKSFVDSYFSFFFPDNQHYNSGGSTDPNAGGSNSSADAAGLPEYEHYNPGYFNNGCFQMSESFQNGDTENAFYLYEQLFHELKQISENYANASIRFSIDISNTYYQKEEQYALNVYMETRDRFLTVCHDGVTGNCSEAFRQFLDNEDLVSIYEEYEPMTEEEEELYNQESELVQDYYLEMDNTNMWGQVDGEALGKIFLKLLNVRRQIAALYGYDNFADYADQEIYVREYSAEDLEPMKEAVRQRSDLSNFVYEGTESPEYRITDIDQLFRTIRETLSGISPLAEDTLTKIYADGLYSIGSDDGRMDASYSTYLDYQETPFLFSKLDGYAMDVFSIVHETGHCTAFYNEPRKDVFMLAATNLDLMEVHSQGLEMLFNEKAADVFGSTSDLISLNELIYTYYGIIEGCIYDDWQRKVYADPDMTLEEIDQCYIQTLEEYGIEDAEDWSYYWVLVSHNFESPMYYISYAVSAFAALQIWMTAQTDFSQAVSQWETLVLEGSVVPYEETLEKAGLRTVLDEEMNEEILERLEKEITDLLSSRELRKPSAEPALQPSV